MTKKTSRAAALKLLLLPPIIAAALAAFAETRYIVHDPETNTAPEKEQLYLPFGNTFRFAAGYGKSHKHPVTGKEYVHTGIDVVPVNDTIFAPYSGVVKSATAAGAYGNKLVIMHPDSLETTWAHLAEFLVSEGETVKGGQPIAIVGSTGHSTGKHLHLETRVGGELTDPMKTLFDVEVMLSGTAAERGGMITLNRSGAK